ncbi:MAG: SagB/ThcOx family dehydrogenase [Myxococcales bacterium]|nr:MAG: SagB/ThcOx family dehydrogenase [Myxococcales bacterium]
MKPLGRQPLSMPLGEALAKRRSIRSFLPRPLTNDELGALLWAAQGITDSTLGLRVTPSSGAAYPNTIYAFTAEGVFRYDPAAHALEKLADDDRRPLVAAACHGQRFIATAPLVAAIAGEHKPITPDFDDRSTLYMILEAGHAAQNFLLAAAALNLGAVPIGAFSDETLTQNLGLGGAQTPMYILCAGAIG